jgi:hypothetical protein
LLSETTSISAVSNKALIDALVTKGVNGKKYASGTVTSSSTNSSFTTVSGGVLSYKTITVSGLSFKPSIIYAFALSVPTTYFSLYTEYSNDSYPKTVKVMSVSTASTASGAHIKGDTSPATVTNGSFTLPAELTTTSYTWIAIE